MKTIKCITLIIIGILFSVTTLTAANRYWIATATANWNSTANWSTTSGGFGGASVPGSSDIAIFNAAKVGSCTINANATVLGISIVSGYTGTISQGTYTITVGGSNYSQAAGTFTGGSGKITIKLFTLSGGTFTSTADTLLVQTGTSIGNATIFTHSGGTFNHNNGTVAFESTSATSTYTVDVITASLFYNVVANFPNGVTVNSVLATATNDTVKTVNDFRHHTTTLNGIWRVEGDLFATKGNGGSGKVIMHGSGNQTYTYGSGRLPNLIINKTGGTVSAAGGSANFAVQTFKLQAGTFIAPTGTFFIGGTLTANTTLFDHTAGTFNPNISLVKFDASMAGYTGTIKTLSTTPFYNVWINCTGTQALQNATDTLRVNNDLTLQAGTFNTGTISVKRHVTVTNTFGGTGKLAFTGTTDQDFTLTSATDKLNLTNLIIKQSAGKKVVLKSAATFDQSGQSLTLTRGTIVSTTSNLLAIGHGATVSGASDASYVDGPVKKTGNAAFTFPVGKNGQYRSIAMSAPTNTTDAYTGEYFNSNSNGSYSHGSKDGTLAQLSTSEYWKLDRNNGSTNVNVTLSWENTTSCGFSNTANLKVAAWNGTTWKDKGNNGTTGTTSAGTIVTNASTTYGPYTLGTSATFDCTCTLATEFGAGNTCLTSQSVSSGEKWYKFLADEKNKEITVHNKGALTTANIDKMVIYNSCGGSIVGGDTMQTTSDTLVIATTRNLTVGNYYYIRLYKSATGTGNADYDICLGQEKILWRHPASPWEGCGLDYVQASAVLNQRTQGLTVAGATPPVNLNIAVPGGTALVNAYLYITTLDDAVFNPPGAPLVFDYTLDGTAGSANLLQHTNVANGTCWDPNQAANYPSTSAFTADVTAIVAAAGMNGPHPFNFIIANALHYVNPPPLIPATFTTDVTGATLIVIYRRPCVAGERNGKLDLWEGLEVIGGGGNLALAIDEFNAYENNLNEDAFMVISDVQNNGTNLSVNGSGNQAIAGNMHNFVTMANPGGGYSAGQDIIPFNVTGNGADCYAVSVMGAYTQDGSHECACIGTGIYNLCETNATTLIANHGSSTLTNIPAIRISGTFTVNANLIFDNCQNIVMGPDARILIAPACTLQLKDCYLYACDWMWDGIYVSNSNSRLQVDGTHLEAALNAIVSENGGPYAVASSEFHCCYKGMVVRDYTPGGPSPAPHPGTVTSSQFFCNTELIEPHAYARAFIGIEVNNATDVTIGAANQGENYFYNLVYGIRTINSRIGAYHNRFGNIHKSETYIPSFVQVPIQEGAIYATQTSQTTQFGGNGHTIGTTGTNYNNRFDSCSVGIYANLVRMNAEYNDFNNVTRGVLIQGVRNNSTVSHNYFDNTGNAQGYGTGIQVENIIASPSAATRLTIRNNTITDYRTGIWARNISSIPSGAAARPFWIFDNDIYFGTTNSTIQRYGIRVERCHFALVAKNSVVKTSGNPNHFEYTRLRGISIANSNKAKVYDNDPITKMGQGVYITGNDDNTQFYCNKFYSNYNGFYFGPSPSITFQGTVVNSTANEWYTDLGKRLATNSVIPGNRNWYYRNLTAGDKFDPYAIPLLANITVPISFQFNTSTLNLCGSAATPPDAIVETPTDALREADYGKIMRNEKDYTDYEDAYKQYSNEFAYLVFKYDNDWLTLGADDADYQAWYDSIESSNIGKLLALRDLADTLLSGVSFMQSQPIDTATTLMDDITANKLIESNELAVWDVYFRTFAIDSFALSSADSATLFNIAYQMGSEGGIGVYMARIMLNLDVDLGESNKTDEEYFTEEGIEGIKNFILFPNPAKDEVSILFQGYEEGENVSIELFDITGRKNISKQVYLSGNILTINTAHLEKGIYLYRIDTGSGGSGKGKLIITR